MARRNISLPDDLAVRMDGLADRVNWSAIAQAAFEVELRMHPSWEEDRMNAVLERLKASKERLSKGKLEEGFQAGRKWAEETAEFNELKIVGEQPEWDEDDAEMIDYAGIPAAIEADDPDSFWESVIGDDWRTEINGFFLIGFQRGAKDVWEDVKDLI